MKNKILFGIMSLVFGLFLTGCSDDDSYINSTPLLNDDSVVTGSADVTATSATFHGTVSGLEEQATSAYATGFYYGYTSNDLSEKVSASSAAEFSSTITGTTGTTVYYQAYVTLQGRVTYTGEVKSTVLTNAQAVTGVASDLTANTVNLSGSVSEAPTDAECGIILSGVEGTENVRAGVRIKSDGLSSISSINVNALGLVPNTTYYYVAYLDLGNGVVYGEVKSFTTPAQTFDFDNDFVDLGLSTKWAKYNVGASQASELGGLYGFGDLTGYNTSINTEDYASADIYKSAKDIANLIYDGRATIPTIDEFEELFTECTKEWTEVDGVKGYKFTGPNGNSIFMPAAGSRTQGTTTGEGVEGRYLSGSVNASDSKYAMSYLFNSSAASRSTTPVYQALSVRPVSVAKNVKFDKTLLYKTWELDLTTDGEYKTFPGPTYFYGADDSWRTITNNEPVVGDTWSWEADFAGNSWAVGGSAANCQGYITFNEDGTVEVKHVDADGKETVEKGTYTIDEENKTIDLVGCEVLCPTNFVDGYVSERSKGIKILSLTESSCQLGVYRDASQGKCTLSLNLIPQLEKYGYTAKLTCYGAGPENDAWASATTTIKGGETGTYTITFNTTEPRTNGQVYVLDIPEFATAYPNAFIRIDKIEADGKDVPFDANKFYYGNIEGAGTYRVEMANIWGCGHNDGWNGLKDTPFHKEGGETTNETALAFNSTFAVTFTIVSLDANLSFNVKQTAVGLDDSWDMPGNWGKENPGAVTVICDNFQYKLVNTSNVDLTLTAEDCGGNTPANGAVNLIDVVGIRNYFSGFDAKLVGVTNDGASVSFIADNILYGDIEGNGNFRVELHNIWGSGTASNPAFGNIESAAGNPCTKVLGFTRSSVYTLGNFSANLFALPW